MKKYFVFIIIVVICFFTINDVYAKETKIGTYKIVSALDNSKIMVEKDGNIVLGTENTEFTWDIYSNGSYYYIKNHNDNNYSIDLSGGKLGNRKNIKIFNVNNSKAQKWILNYANDSYYYITSSLGNYNIDVAGGDKTTGTNIWLYKNNKSNAQKWKFVRVDDKKKLLDEGIYIIKSKLNSSNVIDLYNGDTKIKTNIQLYSNNFTWAQVWNLKYNDGYYTITSYLDNKKALDIYAGNYASRNNIWLYNYNNSNAQKFIIKENEDQTYSITSYDGLYAFDVEAASTNSGANLWIYSPNGTDAQKFMFEKVSIDPIETGYYTINSMLGENKAIGVSNPVVFNGKNVDLRTNENHNNTKWYIKKINGDIYNISIAENTKYLLDLKNGNTTSGTNVELYNSNNSKSQKWCIRKNDDNTYSIINVKSGKVLDVYNGSSNDGTNIWTYNSNKSNAQKFKFTKTEAVKYQMAYEEGRYIIKSAIDSSKVLDVYGAYKANGTNVQIYTSNSTNAQNWNLEYIGDGAYVIRSLINPNLVLTADGTNVVSSKYKNNNYQKWYLDKNDDTTTIINIANGKYLNIASNKPVNSTNVSLSDNKSKTSEFILSKATSTIKYKGIDISAYNTITSWKDVSENVDFVIIRAGFGTEILLSDGTDKYQDKKYIEHVKKCEEYNIPYALYFYTYANKLNDSDNPSYNLGKGNSADSDASHMISLINKIKKLGYLPTLKTKVLYDQEETDLIYNKVKKYYNETDNNNSKTRKLLTDIINRFCSKMNSNGYKCGLYASSNWLKTKINVTDVAKNHSIWVAQWPGYTTFEQALSNNSSYTNTDYKLWQFTSSGSVSGISGRVDLDIGYNIFE